MGQFKIEIVAVGGHGCQRELKNGNSVVGCGRMECPDCLTAEFVAKLSRSACNNIESAKLVHWPGQSSEVTDEFLHKEFAGNRAIRIRHGSF